MKASVMMMSGLLVAVYGLSGSVHGDMTDGRTATQLSATPAKSKLDSAFQSAGKIRAPVELGYFLHGKPALGEALDIEVTLTPLRDLDSLEIEIGAKDAIVLKNARRRVISALRGGEARPLRFQALSYDQGAYYVNISVTAHYEGVRQMRHFTIPVNPGATQRQSKRAANVIITPQGERLMVLPARQ